MRVDLRAYWKASDACRLRCSVTRLADSTMMARSPHLAHHEILPLRKFGRNRVKADTAGPAVGSAGS
jgi:hypothetical protein